MWVEQLPETDHVPIIFAQDGETALFIASWKGHMEVVQLLLQKHADVSISKTVYYNTLYYFLHVMYIFICISHHVSTSSTPTYIPGMFVR